MKSLLCQDGRTAKSTVTLLVEMRMAHLRNISVEREWNTTTQEERENFDTGVNSMDNFDNDNALKNPCYDVNGVKVFVKRNIKLAHKECATIRRVCCRPGTDILGGETLFNVNIRNYECMTHQEDIEASVGQGYLIDTGQTFEVFRSANYACKVWRP